ncbi:MAG: response regulator transcription factor [Spirochaetia bacterium]|uniref:response regulator transcription factor n=1 Tax=Treponema berlinense TaxID=225004 RepID=UPI0026EC415E|nr:response regulator transcription factor [Treponema berlinense]MDD5790831.1 response regulator transcription factor [Spirochaetia bacterium]
MASFFVVEDHALTSLGIRGVLSEQPDFVCAGFASQKGEALQKLSVLSESKSLPEIVILDLFLGEESGIDLLKEINRQFPGIKVLIYSMFEKPGIVSLALENGAKGFVSKSTREEELITAVKMVLDGGNYVQHNLVPPLFTYRTMLDSFTKQEQNIFKLILERKNRSQIAAELNIASRSLENYLSRIYSKTGCKGHEELIKKFGE